MRVAKYLGAGLLLLVLVGAFLIRGLRSGPGPETGTVSIVGLDAAVDVYTDSLGVPHIWAETQRDLFFAQGYLHARDRLWQIDMFRRVSRGLLSEIFGESTLETDRFLRHLDMSGAAALAEAQLSPEGRDMVEAYAAGLNAAVDSWSGLLPPEFVVLRARPGRFSVVDVLAIEKVMSWDLSDYGSTLGLLGAAQAIGVDGMEAVRPEYPTWGSTIIPGTPSPDRTSIPEVGRLPSELLIASAAIPVEAEPFLVAVNAVHASNSWVVGPEFSASGKPLLSNDMHLGLNQPNIWYLVGLHAPGIEVVGMSLPGAPGIVAGHSNAVAWGLTNAMLDDTDLFLERVDPADTTRYLTPGGSEPFVVRTELIQVKGRDAPDTLVLRSTRHGPIMTPVEARAGEDLLAFAWVAHAPSTTFDALRGMMMARSVAEFVTSLEGFTSPHQNVVFADTAGSWGYWMAGRVPNRPTLAPPILPVRGWTGEGDWDGFIDFAEHPHAINPEQGFIATANNRQSWASISDRISAGGWAAPWRADRITELLAARTDHDAASLMAIQLDVVSRRALKHRALAVAGFREAGLNAEADQLANWDGAYRVEQTEPALFSGWLDEIRNELRAVRYTGGGGYFSGLAVERALDAGEVTPQMSARAATAAFDRAGGRPWGEVHTLTLDHPLAAVSILERIFGFGERGIARAGGPETVNVASYGGSGGAFTVVHGPSQRHVVDMADPDGSGGFILPGGQSGYPEGRHSLDQLERWERGELLLLPLSRARVEARALSSLRLLPGVGGP